MPTFYNQNAGTNKFKSKNDLQAAKRQKVPLTFLNPTTEEKSPEKSKSKSCLDLENMLSRNYFQAKTSIKVPLTFLNSSKENHQKNRYQNRVWIWKNMLIKKLIPSQMGKSSVKAEKSKLSLDLENSVNQEMTFKPKRQKVRLAFLSTYSELSNK